MVLSPPVWMTPLLRPLRSIANGFGLAWWARVETRRPDVTYWFGPYIRRSSLEAALPPFWLTSAAKELLRSTTP